MSLAGGEGPALSRVLLTGVQDTQDIKVAITHLVNKQVIGTHNHFTGARDASGAIQKWHQAKPFGCLHDVIMQVGCGN